MARDIRELIEQLDAARALCPFDVLLYERADAREIAFGGRLAGHAGVADARAQCAALVEHVGDAAGHARGEVLPDLAQTRTHPPVMYSQPHMPRPSTTAVAPELRTANRWPARPFTNMRPLVAPIRVTLPTITFSSNL